MEIAQDTLPNLKNDYIKTNNMTFNGIDYKNFFVKTELKVTYLRKNFIFKFLILFITYV